MKFLILYLLMTLAVVFALPTNMEKRGDIKLPKSSCKPSTLIWRIRNVGSSKPQESFLLQIRSTYSGRTSFTSPRAHKTINSSDNKFSVNHGTSPNGETLTLTYLGAPYRFSSYNYVLTQGVNGNNLSKEYQYWICINA